MAYSIPRPTHVEVTEEGLKTLTDTFKNSYKEIVGQIDGATNFGVQNRKVILAQIDKTLEDLGVNVNEFIRTKIPQYYKKGANQAVQQLTDMGYEVPVKTGFNVIHRQAIAQLVSETSSSFADSIQGVARSASMLLNKQIKAEIKQRIATGVLSGQALKDSVNSIKQTLEDQGLSALVDKSGKQWQLDSYAEMLYRTKTVEARNMGMANRMVENGYDLVQVSIHGADDVCGDWEGKILSLNGDTPGYPTVDEATADGLFHPNCRHAINALVPDLAKETEAYDPVSGDYEKGGNLDIAKKLTPETRDKIRNG